MKMIVVVQIRRILTIHQSESNSTPTQSEKPWRYGARLTVDEIYAKRIECIHEAIRVAKLKARPEHIVEGVGQATEQKDTWRLKKSTIQTALPKSDYVQCIQDVVAAGRARLARLHAELNLDDSEDETESSDVESTSSDEQSSCEVTVLEHQVEKHHSWQPMETTICTGSKAELQLASRSSCRWQCFDACRKHEYNR